MATQRKRIQRKKPSNTFDIRIEGDPWIRNIDRDAMHHAITSAFVRKDKDQDDMLFVIQENASGGDMEQFFCMSGQMWEALCETPQIMTMFLNMGWSQGLDDLS